MLVHEVILRGRSRLQGWQMQVMRVQHGLRGTVTSLLLIIYYWLSTIPIRSLKSCQDAKICNTSVIVTFLKLIKLTISKSYFVKQNIRNNEGCAALHLGQATFRTRSHRGLPGHLQHKFQLSLSRIQIHALSPNWWNKIIHSDYLKCWLNGVLIFKRNVQSRVLKL